MTTVNKYHNGKIYKITDVAYTKCYVGSTCQELSQRMAQHRRDYKLHLNCKSRYISSFELFQEFGIENCKIELISECQCETKEQLNKIEGKFIKNLTCVNKFVAGRTHSEYYQDNKAAISEYRKQHYQDNKESISEYQKQHYQDNKEAISEHKKQHYQDNKDKYSEIIACQCGCTMRRDSLSKHMKTPKHIELLKQQQETRNTYSINQND